MRNNTLVLIAILILCFILYSARPYDDEAEKVELIIPVEVIRDTTYNNIQVQKAYAMQDSLNNIIDSIYVTENLK